MSREGWEKAIRIIIAVLSAIAGALGGAAAQSLM